MNLQPTRFADLLGAVVANAYNLLIIGIFLARLAGRFDWAHGIGIISLGAFIPLAYLLVVARAAERPTIYFLWLVLMILFLFVELALDYIFKVEFRKVQWAAILYVMFFCAATGGMIGVAAQAGKGWAALTVCTFLAMVALAFVQRVKTGM